MSAPHLRATLAERCDLALHLAGVTMQTTSPPNCGLPGAATMREAARRMAESRWDRQSADLTEFYVLPIEQAENDRAELAQAMAAGRAMTETEFAALRFLGLWGHLAVRGARESATTDKNGNAYYVRWWREGEPSPWTEIAGAAYEMVLAALADADVIRAPGLRGYAEAIWARLSPAERARYEQTT